MPVPAASAKRRRWHETADGLIQISNSTTGEPAAI